MSKCKLYLISLVSLLSVACVNKQGDTQASVSDGYGSGDVVLVHLKDGTRCAALIGYYKGAIHCDWR